jgi:two-component sensor histidine kinase
VDSHLAHLNRVNATGDAATVLGRSAIYLALALHELGTNALKYGALAHDGGTVDLTWRQTRKGDVHIVWQEECPDFVIPESGDGFGTSLITRIFAASTNGQSKREFTPKGLRWTGVIPTAPDISAAYETTQ